MICRSQQIKNLGTNGSMLGFVLYERYHKLWLHVETLEVSQQKAIKSLMWYAMGSMAQKKDVEKLQAFLACDIFGIQCLLTWVDMLMTT